MRTKTITELKTLAKPLMHLNGSGRNLEDALKAAADSIAVSLKLMRDCAPHPRDYYPLPNGDVVREQALVEHNERVQALCDVQEELTWLWDYCFSARNERQRRCSGE